MNTFCEVNQEIAYEKLIPKFRKLAGIREQLKLIETSRYKTLKKNNDSIRKDICAELLTQHIDRVIFDDGVQSWEVKRSISSEDDLTLTNLNRQEMLELKLKYADRVKSGLKNRLTVTAI